MGCSVTMTDFSPERARRLLLLRHAEAGAGFGDDHERPLTPDGIRQAWAIGRWLAERALVCDLVLCSTAVRTRQTWTAVEHGGARALAVSQHREIYAGGVRGVLQVLARRSADGHQQEPSAKAASPTTVLVVGHAPTMPSLAEAITDGAGDPVALTALERGFPTAALAVVRLHPGIDWAELDRATGELEAFVVGRG